MSNESIAAALEALPLFRGLDAAGRASIVAAGELRHYVDREVVFAEGEVCDGMLVLRSGAVEVTARSTSGEDALLAVLGAGEVLGEMSMADQQRRSASAIARGSVEALYIPASSFEALRQAGDPAAYTVLANICQTVCQRLRRIHGQLADLIGPPEPAGAPRAPSRARTHPGVQDVEFLRQTPFFHAFEREELEALTGYLEVRTVPPRSSAFDVGDRGDGFYIVVSGVIEATACRAGTQTHLGKLRPGRLFGFLSMVDGGPRYACCRALENSRLLMMPRANFQALMEEGSGLAYKLLDGLTVDLVSSLRGADAEVAMLKAERGHTDAMPAAPHVVATMEREPEPLAAPPLLRMRRQPSLRITGEQPLPKPLIDGDIESFISKLEAQVGGFGEADLELLPG